MAMSNLISAPDQEGVPWRRRRLILTVPSKQHNVALLVLHFLAGHDGPSKAELRRRITALGFPDQLLQLRTA